ncbi:MAG: hypothetical protein ACRC4M_00605, partial [Mycoplasma sp.]
FPEGVDILKVSSISYVPTRLSFNITVNKYYDDKANLVQAEKEFPVNLTNLKRYRESASVTKPKYASGANFENFEEYLFNENGDLTKETLDQFIFTSYFPPNATYKIASEITVVRKAYQFEFIPSEYFDKDGYFVVNTTNKTFKANIDFAPKDTGESKPIWWIILLSCLGGGSLVAGASWLIYQKHFNRRLF